MAVAKPAAAASARPSRRAAAAKATYTFDDASEESEVDLLDDGTRLGVVMKNVWVLCGHSMYGANGDPSA